MVGRRKKGDGFEEKEQLGSREGVVRGLSLCLVPKKSLDFGTVAHFIVT